MSIRRVRPYSCFKSRTASAPRSAGREPYGLSVLFAVSVAAVVLGGGCHWIFPYDTRPAFQCKANVGIQSQVPFLCDGYIAVTSQNKQSFQLAVFENSDPSKLPKLYVDQEWVPAANGFPDILKGTCLVRPPYADQYSTANPYLELTFTIPLAAGDTIYVAFDRRAKTLPPWISAFNPVGGAILRSTEKRDAPGSPAVQYQVYEAKDPSSMAGKASFGGNNLGTVWQGGETGSQYLVFVKKLQTSTTVVSERLPIAIEACSATPESTQQQIFDTVSAPDNKKAILEQWLAENRNYEQAYADGRVTLAFQASDCGKVESNTPGASVPPPVYPKSCGKTDVANSTQAPLIVNAWPRQSTAFIDAGQSKITVQARGTSRTTAVSGPISFRIDENSNLVIDEMSLFTDLSKPLVVEGTQIDKVSMGQRGAFLAQCADTVVPKPYGLCSNYTVPPAHAPVAGLGATMDGNHMFTSLSVKQPVAVTVDHNTHSFKLAGGGISGRIETSDGPVDVRLALDITGKFENFAPIASAKESPKRFECRDANKGSATLDAGASYDRDQSSTTLVYKWVEDAGTPAQRLLGNQRSMTNVPMNFGGHRITLFVEDARGAISSETFDIEVYDSGIDHYDTPSDVYVASQGKRTTVALPKLNAADVCSGRVLVTNDAPAKMQFPEGFTPVKWTLDDYRGNIVRQWQNVFVVPVNLYPPPIATGGAWLIGTPGSGQFLIYIYGTKAQGKAVPADEYILLETPRGEVYSFDPKDQLGKPNEIVRHQTTVFGAANTNGFLVVNQWEKRFRDKGTYVLRHIVARERGDPRDNRSVLSLHRFDLNAGQ